MTQERIGKALMIGGAAILVLATIVLWVDWRNEVNPPVAELTVEEVEIVIVLVRALNNSAKLAHRNTKSHSYWLSFRECDHATCKAAADAIREAEQLREGKE